jgi:hypothetical protein
MKPKANTISMTIEAATITEAQQMAQTRCPRHEITIIEPLITCPWCSGEGCSVYNIARGGCKDGEVPESQARTMRKS